MRSSNTKGEPPERPANKVEEEVDSSGSGSTSADEEGVPSAGNISGWKRRYTILLMTFIMFVLCNMDRVNMSITIMPISKEAGWDSATVGLVQSSFFWGYLLTQIIGGVWADKHGAKKVLGFGVVWWSLATMLTPLAAKSSLGMLLLARVCMGVGEGVAVPATNNLLSKWVPVQERSRSLALVHSGLYTGAVLGLSISPRMVQSWGWPSVFYVFGGLGLLWWAWWDREAASSPGEDASISRKELMHIRRNASVPQLGKPAKVTIPWKLLLSQPAVWALIVCHFCHSWGISVLATWMPTYYNQVLGLDLNKSGLLSSVPWLTQALAANAAGWIADYLVDQGMTVTAVRKRMQAIAFLGPAVFLSQLGSVRTAGSAVLCLVAAQGLNSFSKAGLFCNHQDIGPQYAGVLLGLSHTAGVLAGVIGTWLTGIILQHAGWPQVWHVAVGLYLVGTLVWSAFATGERVFD